MSDFTKFFTNAKTGQVETIGATKITAVDLRGGTARIGSGKLPGIDTLFFVSGSLQAKDEKKFGVSVFGGDLIVSGAVSGELGLSGSLTRLTDGTPYLIGGTGVSIRS